MKDFPQSVCMKSACSRSLGFACCLISHKPYSNKSTVCVCVCRGHASGANPWQRANNSQQTQRECLDSKYTNILPHPYTVLMYQVFLETPHPTITHHHPSCQTHTVMPTTLSFLYTHIYMLYVYSVTNISLFAPALSCTQTSIYMH